jgi:hypothetical protein
MVPGIKRIYIQVGLVPALVAVLLGLSLLSFGQVSSLTNHSKTVEGFLAQGDAFLRQGQYDSMMLPSPNIPAPSNSSLILLKLTTTEVMPPFQNMMAPPHWTTST